MSDVLCITGMHRSGTSLTASWLAECGVVIADGHLIGAAEGNPRGHFEDGEFVLFQDALMRQLDPDSNGWIVRDQLPATTDSEFDPTAKELIERRNEKYDTWGWKDPRTVVFLERWKALLPDLKVLFLWRPCVEVVGSLVSRSEKSDRPEFQVSMRDAVDSWVSYNRAILAYRKLHREDTLLVGIRSFLKRDREGSSRKDRKLISRIKHRLGVELAYRPMADFFDDKLLTPRRGSATTRSECGRLRVRLLEWRLRWLSDF